MTGDAHERLVELVAKAPSREWIEEYFSHLNDLLSHDQIDYREGDDRLVTSLRSDRVAVTMNSRYVLVAFLNKQRIGFLVRNESKQIDELIKDAEGRYSFDALPGEQDSETPDWVEFEDASRRLANDSIRKNWLTASSIEFNRWSGSPSKNAHEPLVQEMAMNEEYRDEVLAEAFGSS